MTEDYTDAVEKGIASRRSGRESAESTAESLAAPESDLEALAFWERLAEVVDGQIRSTLADASKNHGWAAIGAVLATSATSAAQRHRRYEAKAKLTQPPSQAKR